MGKSGHKNVSRIGMLGGTFDPVHNGHLALARAARDGFALDQVLFIPAAQPPHKLNEPVSSFHHRAAMLELALATEPAFVLSRMEEHRPGPSYSIDTLRQLRQSLPPACRLFFIIGADAFAEIATWKNHGELFCHADFLVAERPDKKKGKWGQTPFPASDFPAGRIHPLPLAGVDISATEVRRLAQSGKSLAGLTPEPVIVYIREHGLYQTTG